jgi:hypothetical protein
MEGVLLQDQKKDTLLFAGKVKVRITNWFFFKDKAELKYVGLEDAIINLNRTDSVWNYRFIQDYFSGGTSTEKKEGIAIHLKKVELRNIYILQNDVWRGEDLHLQLKTFDLDADEINFNTKKADINSLVFSNPLFQIKNYSGLKPASTGKPAADETEAEKKTDSLLKWNAAGWIVHIDKLKIADGTFRNEQQSTTPYFTYFDGRHIDFSSIYGSFKNINWLKDTVTASMDLQTKERSGFEVKSMIADIKFTPQSMVFTNMEIKTNKSIIRNSFSMRYASMNELDYFISKVKMTAGFENSEIDSDDIAFFAPELGAWKKKITVSGNVRGTVEDLFGNNMNIQAGRNTILNGDISLAGLPDINRTFIDFKADNFQTTYHDAVTFIPFLKSVTTPRLQNISYVNFTGNFTGFLRDFVTFGTIRTNLGTVTSDLNMKLPEGKDPSYSGNIATADFNLGSFINEKKIGAISFSGQLKGTGVKWNTLAAEMDMSINFADYNNYRYENITAKGSLNKKVFNGNFAINDTNAIASLNGIVDLSGEMPRFNFIADVKNIHLKNLKLSKDNFSLKGKIDFDFAGRNIDNFLGRARITDARLRKDDQELPVDSFVINSEYLGSAKHLTVKTNELKGNITGDFSILDMPDAFKLFLNKYYPAYIKEPTTEISDQAFTFDIQTNYVDEFINLFDSSLHGFNNSRISGSLNTASNQMELKTDVPSFAYKKYEFQNINLNAKGDMQKLALTGIIDQMKISDSLSFPYTRFDLVSQNDISDIKIVTLSNNKSIPGGNINARVKSFNDGIAVKFDTSSFIVSGKQWSIEKNGELEIRSNQVSNGQIILKESNQEISLRTLPSDIGNWNDIKIDLKNFNIGDITQFFVKSNIIEGLASGSITIEDPVNTFNVVSDIQTNQLRIDNDSIGQLSAHVFYNNKSGKLTVAGQNLNPEEKLNFDLNLFLKNLSTNGDDVITITPENYPVKIVERFIGDLFTDLQGKATGQIKIIGRGNNRKYVGKAKLREAGLKVIFTQCFYKIPDTEIIFREDALELGTLKLIDTITKNTATLSRGLIKHDSWQNMVFDIKAETDNKPLQLLNTTARDNESFYGTVRGTGSFTLTGPQSHMRMKIIGVASATDSAYITIPNTSSRESGIADFLIERKYGREMTDTATGSNETNLTYDIDIKSNPLVNIRVVIDELTNDEIRGRGEGNLRILSGTSEPLSIRGRYNINEGNYRFTFQSFFKKPFELKKDAGNYIEWNGDPNHPTVKIEAVYKTEKKVDFSPLISGLGSSSSLTGFRDYVYVIAKLSGDLFKPDITFALDFPPESPPKKDLSVSFVVDQLQNNENELNKQVAFLVVFNSFAPSDVGTSLSIYSGVNLVVNSISGFLSSQINNVLNNILSNKLKIPGLYVNFSGSLYNPNPFGSGTSGFSYDRTNLNLAIGKTLFDNRAVLTFEGSYDVPFQSSGTQIKSDLLTNFTTEFLLNKSGTIRASIFYKENVDILSGTAATGNNKSRKYGSSLAYRREFNKLNEFFGRKKIRIPVQKAEEKKEGN